MPTRDIFHEHVVRALINDGWIITDDPLRLRIGKKDLWVDLGAERLLCAQKDLFKIAVEIKSFVGASDVTDLHDAVGQFVLYHDVMLELHPDRVLYLAVRDATYETVFESAVGALMLKNQRVKLLVFSPEREVIVAWIPEIATES